MRAIGPIFALVTLLILGFGFWHLNKQLPEAVEPEYIGDYNTALERSATEGKPVIFIFSASWCGPCQQMRKQVYPSPQVQNVAGGFIWAYLDVDKGKNRPWAEKYGVRGIPHIVVTDSKGNVRGQVVGSRSPDAFAAFLKERL